MAKVQSASGAIQSIRSFQRVFVHGAAATPQKLLDALVDRAPELRDVELIHLHTEGKAEYAQPKYRESFKVVNLFVGSNLRSYTDFDRVDYLPCFLSEIPQLFYSEKRSIDVALLHLSPPDSHGYCSLGTSVDVARAAFETAETVIAQVNHRMPRVHGDSFIHISDVDDYIEIDELLPEPVNKPLTSSDKAIGKFVAGLIEDGSCLQIGIGSIPNAVLNQLMDRRHLGIHSEMWSDGVLRLILAGVIDNSKKSVHTGKTVSGFVNGSRVLYEFIHDNPSIVQLGIDYVNNPNVIARNSKVVAINSAVAVDLTGQVCADSIGPKIISGVGGQMDFIRGAALSPGGKPIIALSSRTLKGTPKIVPFFRDGSGVVTTRAHIHYIVTEYGVADLFGKTLGERARALIDIAHPEDREWLAKEWLNLVRWRAV